MTWLLSRSLVVLVGLHLTVWVCWGEAAPIEHKSEHGEGTQDGSNALPHGHAGEEKVAEYAQNQDVYVLATQTTAGSTLPSPTATIVATKGSSRNHSAFSPAWDPDEYREGSGVLDINPRQLGTGKALAVTFITPTTSSASTANPFSLTLPTYSYPEYTWPTYSYPDYTWPTYSYPDYTWPTYSYPDYTYPTYSYPDYTWPTYTYPTPTFDSGEDGGDFGGGGGGGSSNFELPKMRRVNVKTVIGAVVGSVAGFFALIGGIWAGLKRRARNALNRQKAQEQQIREADQRVPFIGGNESGSGGPGHTPSMSQASGGGGSGEGMPYVPQPTSPPSSYVPTRF